MSSAYKCDRCGEYFCLKNFSEDERVISFHQYYVCDGGSRKEYKAHVDLCPGCSEKFAVFMKETKEEEPSDEKAADPDDILSGAGASMLEFWRGVFGRLGGYAESNQDVCNGESSEWEGDSEEERED